MDILGYYSEIEVRCNYSKLVCLDKNYWSQAFTTEQPKLSDNQSFTHISAKKKCQICMFIVSGMKWHHMVLVVWHIILPKMKCFFYIFSKLQGSKRNIHVMPEVFLQRLYLCHRKDKRIEKKSYISDFAFPNDMTIFSYIWDI